MISVREYGIEPDRIVEVLVGSAYVPEIVFGYASEKETPIVGGVQAGKDIELLYCLCVFAFRKSLTPTPHEDVLVVLGKDGIC